MSFYFKYAEKVKLCLRYSNFVELIKYKILGNNLYWYIQSFVSLVTCCDKMYLFFHRRSKFLKRSSKYFSAVGYSLLRKHWIDRYKDMSGEILSVHVKKLSFHDLRMTWIICTQQKCSCLSIKSCFAFKSFQLFNLPLSSKGLPVWLIFFWEN